MPHENLIYAVNAHQLSNNEQEDIIILIYAASAEIAKNHITVYQQQNQIRLQYFFLPLPLNTYFQRHADETLIAQLKTTAQELSEQHPVIIFNPNQYRENEKSTIACLIKTEFPLRREDERTPFLFQPIPDTIKPYLWPEDNSAGQCYAIINAEVSFWFPQRFELDDIHYACLFKGEEGEKRKRTAPYLLHLPENHPFVYDGRLLYFRFYDPTVLEDYFDRLMYYPKKLATFWGGGLIDSISLPKGHHVVHYAPTMEFAKITPAKKQFDRFEMNVIVDERNASLLTDLVNELLETTPILNDYYERETIEKVVQHCYRLCKTHALYQTIDIGLLTLLSLAYGNVIDRLDPEKKINQILQSDITEQKKRYLIKQRISVLENKNIIRNKLGANLHG